MKKQVLILILAVITIPFGYGQTQKNILIYNITSTDCGPCSCMDSVLKYDVKPSFPNTVIVAFHGPGSYFNEYDGKDVLHQFHQKLEPSCFPDGLGYDAYYLAIHDTLQKLYTDNSTTPVSIEIDSKTYDPVSRNVDLTLSIRNDGPEMEGRFWYNVIVSEDNVKHWHRCKDSCLTPDHPTLPIRNDYFNFWATRKMVFYSQGDSLIGPTWPEQESITRSCSFELDTGWVAENCFIVVDVYKKADSLYKSPVLQAIRRPITSGLAVQENYLTDEGIIRVYPNPVSDICNLHLSISSGSECSLNIFDTKGQIVKNLIQGVVKPGLYNVEINMREFPGGTYIVVLRTNSGLYSKKILVE